jgi:uncharacterized membrane protein
MRLTGVGQVLFALSFAAIGALSIGWSGFAETWEVLPKWLAANHALILAFAAVYLLGGIALLIPPTARLAALALAVNLFLRLLVLHGPHVWRHPLVEGVYESMGENIIYLGGAWMLFSMLSQGGGAAASFANIRAGQIIFALALPGVGLSHFFYLNMTAPLIPSWLPFHVALAYFTGAAWIAAAIAIFFDVAPGLAATLTAIMVSLFTLLIWVPAVIATPANISDWSELCSSTAITGAAWAVAESFGRKYQGQNRQWFWPRRVLTARHP